ncbi:hypothetical protein [Aureimonas mangrovi]|uniref:hypothetical protein n=1 Tax=Aureimonas mangrovi TaxID=2758041 RepID=UPI00163D4E2E|nr:hypothetical protein [Aureimonas mangrovi]
MIAVLRFLFVIPLAFVAGCFAASIALLWPFLDLAPVMRDDPVAIIQLFIGFMAQAAQIGTVALVPWAIFMVVTEIFAISSVIVHIITGIVAGLALTRHWYGDGAPGSIETAMTVGGLAFFLVYWTIAGRSAGGWRRNAEPRPRDE